MTFKDLTKRVNSIIQQQSNLFERLHNKPFWIWNIEEHKREDMKTDGDCRLNHIIGLPIKGMIEKQLFDYEKLLCGSLLGNKHSNILNHAFKHKHLWVKKSTGLEVRVLPQANGMAMLEK